MIVTIIVFLLVFSVVVISHEFGHYIVAKLNGIKVLEFGIGMGPIIAKYTKNDTQYVLRLLPLGGACVFEGMDGIYDSEENKTNEKREGSFNDANVWARIATVFAGPFFNIILGFLLSLIVVGFSGSVIPTINTLMDGYPAAEAGLEPGDTITKINGERVYLQGEVTLISSLNDGEDLTIEFVRDGEKMTTVVTPKYSEEDERYYIGFTLGQYVDCQGLKLIQYSYYEVRYWLKATVKSIAMLCTGRLSADNLSGPVGVAQMVDETLEETRPYGLPTMVLTMINFAVLLSVNLGVMNLIPIPALDGGRLLLLIIEVIRGKKLPPEKEGIVTFVGVIFLMGLMVFALYNDISRLFR